MAGDLRAVGGSQLNCNFLRCCRVLKYMDATESFITFNAFQADMNLGHNIDRGFAVPLNSTFVTLAGSNTLQTNTERDVEPHRDRTSREFVGD